MQAILDEDDTLSQKQMAEIINVVQEIISDSLKAMGKIQKHGKWVPHELNEKQIENRKTLAKFCFKDTKEIQYRIELLLAMKNGFILQILNGKNSGLTRENHQYRLQNQIDSARRQCCVSGGTRKVWCTISS